MNAKVNVKKQSKILNLKKIKRLSAYFVRAHISCLWCVPVAGFQILLNDLFYLISGLIISTGFSHKVLLLFFLPPYHHTKHLPTLLSVERFRDGFLYVLQILRERGHLRDDKSPLLF